MIIEKNRAYRIKFDSVIINEYKFKNDIDYIICAISLYDVYFYNKFFPISKYILAQNFELSPFEQRKDKLKKLTCLKNEKLSH